MRPRYLAIIGFDGDGEAGAAVAARAVRLLGLGHSATRGKLILLTDSSRDPASHGKAWLIAGRICKRGGNLPPDHAESRADEDLTALVRGNWGDYVAFRQSADSSVVDVIRSPSGGLSAFRACMGNLTVIASDIDMLLTLKLAAVTIDWSFVAHHLAFPHLRGAATGLTGVDELFAGDHVAICADGAERGPLWSPWLYAEPCRQFATFAAARSALRQALLDSVAALAQPHGSVLLELSGGLDSSIIAACLQPLPAQVGAVNLVTPGMEGDERRYARLVSARTGIAVTEVPIPADIDLTSAVRRTARPGLPGMLQGVDAAFAHAAHAQGHDVFFSGTGGDSVFCSLGSSAPAADAWRTFGPGRQFVRAVRNVAELHDINLWRAGIMALRYARRAPGQPWPRTTDFLRADRLPAHSLFHPWLVEPKGALGGTRSHIRSIMAALAHTDGYARHAVAPSVFPLLSQPVIETCLRIPTWMWVDGGRDRAVARRAFQDVLPPAIVNRRSKGAMDALCVRTFQNNRARLRAFLSDGHLAAAGLLDEPRIALYLGSQLPIRDDLFYRLLPIVDTEAWLRAWLGSNPRTPA